MSSLRTLLADIRSCRLCERELPLGPRPIVAASRASRILLVGQAPGRRVHESGIPWRDPSGDRLRDWLGVTEREFYDEANFALTPIGFCYPGTGDSGDLPPRPECAATWHERLFAELKGVKLRLALGDHAQRYLLGAARGKTLTETVRNWKSHRPAIVPLPHPSPRNNRWLSKNPWFEAEVLPYLKRRVRTLIGKG